MPLRHPKSWDNDWGALGSEDSRWESQSTGSPDFNMASESFASQRRKATPRNTAPSPESSAQVPRTFKPQGHAQQGGERRKEASPQRTQTEA